METKKCVLCETEMPVQRPYDKCKKCNRAYVGTKRVQAAYGFKANGANLVKKEKLREHMENQQIRG